MNLIAVTLATLILGQSSQPADQPQISPSAGRRQGQRSLAPAPLRNLSPADRDRMQVDRWVQRATRTYQLDSAQEAMVRAVLESFRNDRQAAMGTDAAEYENLRKELAQFWNESAAEEGQTQRRQWRKVREDPKAQEIRRKIREIEKKYPFDWETAMQRCEKLIPAEQVQNAHDRQEQRRQAAGARRRSANPFFPPAGPAGPGAIDSAGQSRDDRARQELATPPAMDPWEKYTRDFIRVNKLDSAQSNSALSILKDLRSRASQIEHSNADRIKAADALPDQTAREKIAELNQPIEKLFDELKARLDGLLTAAQRAARDRSSHP